MKRADQWEWLILTGDTAVMNRKHNPWLDGDYISSDEDQESNDH